MQIDRAAAVGKFLVPDALVDRLAVKRDPRIACKQQQKVVFLFGQRDGRAAARTCMATVSMRRPPTSSTASVL